MLHDFIVANREELASRARKRAVARWSSPNEAAVALGIPLFLDHLADALVKSTPETSTPVVSALDSAQRITDSAALHGHELLKQGLTIGQVVHAYGDVCQAVTELADETDARISSQDFHVFNRCLDNAIAGAVTSYARQRELELDYGSTERLGVLAHELRNLLNAAILSFDVIRQGVVGLNGSTAAIHGRSLAGLRALVERSLAEVRLETASPILERISVTQFIDEVSDSAAMQAEGLGLELSVPSFEGDLTVDADWQLLSSAALNLLLNAFKFSQPHGKVTLSVRATTTRVLIEVADACGGLKPGAMENFFHPFQPGQAPSAGQGLGLGLAIARKAVRANMGDINVRDVPGTGCVFSIELPRQHAPPTPISHVQRPADN